VLPPAQSILYQFTATQGTNAPIGNTALLGYFDSPRGEYPNNELEHIPKRKDELQLPHNGDCQIEWGLHFIEGPRVVSIALLFLFAVFLSVGVFIGVYKKTGNIGQGAGASAGIASLFALLFAALGYLRKSK